MSWEVTMRRFKSAVSLFGVLVFVAALAGQSRPNFSGRWVQLSPSEGAGTEQRITHEGNQLLTQHASEGDDHELNYRLDGVETRSVITSHGEEIVSKSRAVWEQQQLVITTATEYPDGRKLDTRQVWSLDAKGQLNIAVTRSMTGREPTSVTAVFAKK